MDTFARTRKRQIVMFSAGALVATAVSGGIAFAASSPNGADGVINA